VTRGDDLEHNFPAGFMMVDEMYAEAGLRDPITAEQSASIWKQVRIFQRALQREFGGAVRLRILNPWTPEGLWFVVRHRLREFPLVVIGKQRYPLDTSLETLLEAVRRLS
jgi:hypothetical protein